MSLTLTDRFIEGLKNYSLTYEDLIKYGWMYAGGDYDEHLRYFWLITEKTNLTQPEHECFCICGVSIKRNAYIMNRDKTRMLVIGSCCIKRFMPEGKKGRTCEICEKPHKNRKVNRCNDCKDIVECSRCKTQFKSNYGYEKCYGCMYIKECIKCKKEHKNSVDKCDHCCNRFKCGVCADCGKSINEKYKMCYTCYQPKLCENSEKILAHFK